MLDMGFIHDVRRVIDKTPEKKQTLLFSATMPPEIQEIADRLLHDMAVVQVDPVSYTHLSFARKNRITVPRIYPSLPKSGSRRAAMRTQSRIPHLRHSPFTCLLYTSRCV